MEGGGGRGRDEGRWREGWGEGREREEGSDESQILWGKIQIPTMEFLQAV